MSTGVIITLIICSTLVVITAINAISKATEQKRASKMFSKEFFKFNKGD